MTPTDLAAELRTAGFDASNGQPSGLSGAGSFHISDGRVEIIPAGSRGSSTVVLIVGNRVDRVQLNGKEVKETTIGFPLITTLSSSNKEEKGGSSLKSKNEERLLVNFSGIPPVLVHAVVSAEDKRFFKHHGLDLPRIARAAYVDARDHRKEQGASTLTMQLVRGLWLEPDKLWMRKLAEAVMTIHLEREWSKERIFETYANQVYLGRQAAYSIHGFGQGSRLFFGKELRDITLPEAALMAGLVQRPSYFNPFRYPERGQGTPRPGSLHDAWKIATSAPRNTAQPLMNRFALRHDSLSEARAPYFLDVVNDELQAHQTDNDSVRNVYSTIDLNLQRAADEAVAAGMQEVDKLLAKRSGDSGQRAEAALIALDPHTGEIKALVGGRDYGRSQLNRILAKRPPGSVFKPFVYALALDTAVAGRRDGVYPGNPGRRHANHILVRRQSLSARQFPWGGFRQVDSSRGACKIG